jgi:hypothetical protein
VLAGPGIIICGAAPYAPPLGIGAAVDAGENPP